MSEEQPPESNSPAPAKGMEPRRRRGHRGGRGRGRSPRPPLKKDLAEPASAAGSPAQIESPAPVESAAPPAKTPIRLSERPARPLPSRPLPPRPRLEPVAHAPRVPRTDGSAISQAVNEGMQVVESLKQ